MNQLTKKWATKTIPQLPTADKTEHSVRDTPRRPLPEIVGINDFLAMPLATPDELVEGMIHKGTQSMLAGGSKSFKTWALLDLALSVSTGSNWWGRKTVPGKVLYLNLEIDAPFFQKRLMEIAAAKELQGPYADFDVWNLRGHVADIATLLPEILKRCEGEGYGLIIPDPIYKVLGDRNENAAGEIATFLNCLDEIAVRTGAALVYGHHFAKGSAASKEQLDRASGSGVFARYPDGIITLTRHEVENAFTVEATLRNFKAMTPFVVCWEFPLMRINETLDPHKLKSVAGRPKKHTIQQVAAFLKDGMTKPQWKEAAKAEGASESTFYELATKAEESGSVERYRHEKKDLFRRKNSEVDFRTHGKN